MRTGWGLGGPLVPPRFGGKSCGLSEGWRWGEPQVTSVAVTPAGGLGSPTALCSGVCLLAAFEAAGLVECCGPSYVLGVRLTVFSCWWVSKMAAWSPLPTPGRLLMSDCACA